MQPATFREIQPQINTITFTDINNYPHNNTVESVVPARNPPEDLNMFFQPTSENFTEILNSGSNSDRMNQNPQKPKRKQVKNACVNCQRACKKCDDGRPCNRCIKLGLTATCRDSDRKERKKGVKRGPYKKRQASNYKDKSEIGNINKFLKEQQLPQPAKLPTNAAQAAAATAFPTVFENIVTEVSNNELLFRHTSFVGDQADPIHRIDNSSGASDASIASTLTSLPTCTASSSSLSLSTAASSLLPSPLISNTSLDTLESDETLHYAYGYTAEPPTISVAGLTNSHRRNLSSTTSSSASNMLDHQAISGYITPIQDMYSEQYQQPDVSKTVYYPPSQRFIATDPYDVFNSNIVPFLTGKESINNQQQQVYLDLNQFGTDPTANMYMPVVETTSDGTNYSHPSSPTLLLQQQYNSNFS